jgi:diguanylate cyclase (GGDEF)-like protein/PAS domain S-box-containing protein
VGVFIVVERGIGDNMTALSGVHDTDGALQYAREHFRAIVQGSDDAIISKTLDGIITSWNPGATRIFGYALQEVVGGSIQILLPADRQHEEDFILERIRKGEIVDHFETVRVRKDGRAINVSVTISPIRDGSGTIVGASKIARDITFEVAAKAQLRLTASVFNGTSEGILITGNDGLIVEVNRAFTRITGYEKDEALGKDPQRLRSGRQSPRVFRAMRRALMRFGEWKGEIWSRRKNGEAYSTFLIVSRVCGVNGEATNYIVLFSDITPLKLQREQLEHGAYFDALTDLPNRLLLSDRLQQAMVNCQRHGQMLAVLYLDLDGFKAINDNFGHGAGDELLIAVSHHIRGVLRKGDTLARMGGDEFVVVLTEMSQWQDCLLLVNKVVEACARPVPVQGNMLGVTASIGVTLYPADEVDADQLLRHADHAMYEAKRVGKNRFHLFDAAQDAEVKNMAVLQARLEQALYLGEFVLYYQPKVNMRTGVVIGVEALIRWQHPERGLLAPGSFLPLIDKHPLSEAVGNWVLESAIVQLENWADAGLDLPVSINVSARQFQEGDFVARLADALARHPRVARGALELEILETSALDDLVAVQKIIGACHRMGVDFSLDDFGTGYSSLTYLKSLSVATLKIDQSFIRSMLEDPGDLSIVKGVIGLASAFNRAVIAEGVETEAHGQRLLELGCESGQGYAIARPMPASQVADWMGTWRAPLAWTST